MIRIAYIVHTFDMGGVERSVARLVNHLDRAAFHPMIVCLNRSGTAAEWVNVGAAPIIEINKRNGNDPFAVQRVAEVLRRYRIGLVHSHNWGTLVETAVARLWSRTPVHIHAERGMELEAMRASAWRRKLRDRASRWALQQTTCVVTNAEAVRRDVLLRCGRLRTPIRIIPNGVDRLDGGAATMMRERLRSGLGIPAEATVIGSVGRLVPVKDFEKLIEVVAALSRKGLHSHLLLVGGGPQRDAILNLAQIHNISRCVHLVGQQSDVGSWLNAMDIYVNSSLNEGMSQSIVEAMAVGLPLVVTEVGDSADLVNGEDPCGLTVGPTDVAGLAKSVEILVTDSKLRSIFGERARQRHSDKYGVARMVRSYEELYLNTITSKRHLHIGIN